MTYFHVSSPLLAEVSDLLGIIERSQTLPTLVRDRANIARTALSGVNARPSVDNTKCSKVT